MLPVVKMLERKLESLESGMVNIQNQDPQCREGWLGLPLAKYRAFNPLSSGDGIHLNCLA